MFISRGLLILAIVLPTAALAVEREVVDEIAAVIEGEIITMRELETKAKPYMAKLAELETSKRDEERGKILHEVLDIEISERIVNAEIDRNKDKLGVTDVDLVQRINDIDLSDGKLDGTVRKSVVSCPSCGRTMARRFPKCMYCGQAVVQDPFT